MNKVMQKAHKWRIMLIILFSINGLYGCINAANGAGGGAGSGTGLSDADLVAQLKKQIPPVGDDMCGWGTDSKPITEDDCLANDALFYSGRDHPINYVLSKFGEWPEAEIKQLLSYSTVEERYAYFIIHNRGPIKLECDKGLDNNIKDCKVPLLGNRQFQIDYLLCPNLANKYLIMASNDWTLYLNKLFVQCAARGKLKDQCPTQPSVFITTLQDLEAGGNSSKELCLLINVDGFDLYPQKSKARYNIFSVY